MIIYKLSGVYAYMKVHDLNYYKILLQNINNTYEKNILGDQNYSYTVAGEVTPITGNEIIKGVDPIKGYNHITNADVNYNNISDYPLSRP